MNIELCCCTKTLLHEINNPKITKKILSMTYRFSLESNEDVDWKEVNKAIISRWSMRALHDVKNWAWSGKCFKD